MVESCKGLSQTLNEAKWSMLSDFELKRFALLLYKNVISGVVCQSICDFWEFLAEKGLYFKNPSRESILA